MYHLNLLAHKKLLVARNSQNYSHLHVHVVLLTEGYVVKVEVGSKAKVMRLQLNGNNDQRSKVNLRTYLCIYIVIHICSFQMQHACIN